MSYTQKKISSKKKPDWFDEDCLHITNRKNEAYKIMQQQNRTRSALALYRDLRKQEKHIHRKKKRLHDNKLLENIEHLSQLNNARGMYRLVNENRGAFKPRITCCKAKNGIILNENSEILNRWREHFCDLLNANIDNLAAGDVEETTFDQNEDDTPTLEEVRRAVNKLKNGKSPGSDEIPGELIKYGGEDLLLQIHILIKQIWKDKKMPEEWNRGIVCPIHKNDVM
jgi:hypothetical protein